MNTDIYRGPRDERFKQFISGLLEKGKLKKKYHDMLINDKSLKQYGIAFTAASADNVNNYERFEQLGDVTANKFIVWYAYKRFPQLDCTKGVKVVARLRINYGAKETFAPLAESLGFWDYITCVEDGDARGVKYRNRNKKDLLEDTFEAFLGCTEYLLDNMFRPGVGYGIVYDILTEIFNTLDISLRFEDLFDAKTRLKETFDVFSQLGNWVFVHEKLTESNEEGEERYITKCTVYRVPEGMNHRVIRVKTGPEKNDFEEKARNGWIPIGSAISHRKAEAQQKAAAQGIETLKRNGFYKEPPEEYKFFCN